MDISCSLGLACCNNAIDYTKEVGKLISWQEAVSIGGIVFAATQFMEAVKIRNYIYRFGLLHKLVPILVGTAITAVIIANFIQLTNSHKPLVSYPAFYEYITLISYSVLLLLFVIFFLRARLFLSYNTGLLDKLRIEILYNQTDDNLAAITRIINAYLEDIIKSASKAKRRSYLNEGEEVKEKDLRALEFIETDMSTPNFVKYIANNNIGFIVRFVSLAEKYELWEAGGGIFVDRLTEALFSDENSLLTRELMFGGISGLQKPITNSLFRSNGLLSHYRVLNVNGFWSAEISKTALRNWTHALEVALKHYFSEERNIYYAGTPNDTLNYSLERLGECSQSIVLKINKLKADEVWDNEYGSKLSIIGGFFERIVHILLVEDASAKDKPKFSDQEIKVDDRTVTEGIAKGYFAYLEGCAWMESESNARMSAIEPFWFVFDDHATPVLKGIRLKVLELIKERIAQNLKNMYASMIKMMLLIFDGGVREDNGRGNEIQQYIGSLFREELAPRFLKEKKFRAKHMPKHWYISKDGKEIYRTVHGRKELLYPVIQTKNKKS